MAYVWIKGRLRGACEVLLRLVQVNRKCFITFITRVNDEHYDFDTTSALQSHSNPFLLNATSQSGSHLWCDCNSTCIYIRTVWRGPLTRQLQSCLEIAISLFLISNFGIFIKFPPLRKVLSVHCLKANREWPNPTYYTVDILMRENNMFLYRETLSSKKSIIAPTEMMYSELHSPASLIWEIKPFMGSLCWHLSVIDTERKL